MERDVVDHHHIPAFEAGNRTSFDVRKEGLSVNGSLNNHGRDDPGLTETGLAVASLWMAVRTAKAPAPIKSRKADHAATN